MWRHIASNFLTVLIVLLVLGAGLIGWGQAQYTAAGPLDDPILEHLRREEKLSIQNSGEPLLLDEQMNRELST